MPTAPPRKRRGSDGIRLRRIIASANLTKREAAEALAISERMMRYYTSGDIHVPKIVMLAAQHLFVCQTKGVSKTSGTKA